MNFSEKEILSLRDKIKPYMSEGRYMHTLAVERAVIRIGEILMPSRVNELRVAALLHDIAKDLPESEQIALIESYDSGATKEDLDMPPVLHSFAAPMLVSRDFPEYVTESILAAVKSHTLGEAGMTLFAEIVFLSDYIEDTRKHDSCKSTMQFVYSNLSTAKNEKENSAIIHRAVQMSIENTVKHLKMRSQSINSRTVTTLEYVTSLLNS